MGIFIMGLRLCEIIDPGLNAERNHRHWHKVIEVICNQIGQMAEELKAQKALEKLHIQTIVQPTP
jgi:hypothetical protein